MAENHKSFLAACLAGEATAGDIDDWIEAWHTSPTGLGLDAYLGFSADEGARWAEHPESLRSIIEAHRTRWH